MSGYQTYCYDLRFRRRKIALRKKGLRPRGDVESEFSMRGECWNVLEGRRGA